MATCTAPGHPDCTITCDNGCYAIYSEPDGPCTTGCSNSLKPIRLSENQRFTIALNELAVKDLAKVIDVFATHHDLDQERKITLSLKSVTLPDLVNDVLKRTRR